MIRRPVRHVPLLAHFRAHFRGVATAALGALALSACSTVSDNSVVARVDDAEMSDADLSRMLVELTGDDEAATAPAEAANQLITTFILNEALRSDLAAAGIPLPDDADDVELTAAGLDASANAAFTEWQTLPPPDIDATTLEAMYSSGPVESSIACTAHILVETDAAANEVLARLSDGDSFADLAVEYSIDPGSGQLGGVLPCSSTGAFANTYIPEFVDAVLTAEVGDPVGPVESQFGYHVIVVRPFADLADGELDAVLAEPAVRFELLTTDLDVFVDPRYGTFDGVRGVVPLGLPAN